jgi:hypothetical protein
MRNEILKKKRILYVCIKIFYIKFSPTLFIFVAVLDALNRIVPSTLPSEPTMTMASAAAVQLRAL